MAWKKRTKRKHHPKSPTRQIKQRRSSLRLVFKLTYLTTFWACFFLFLMIVYFLHDLPDINEMTRHDIRPQITIRNMDNVILARYGDSHGKTLAYYQIPQYMINAVITAEDRRFFDHFGIDPFGIIRAYIVNLKAGKVIQGGSTVTQQLAKIIYLSPERTFKRKFQEVLIAIQLERRFSKEQIMTMYLNRVYLGKGNYGIDAASRYYFGKKAEDLDVFESAVLAAMLKAPSRYAPTNHTVTAIGRAKHILKDMEKLGYITHKEFKSATAPDIVERGSARGILKNPYFADYVLSQLPELIENGAQDLNIYTTLDLHAQEKLEAAVEELMKIHATTYKANQAAAIALEANGAIKAMVGGRSYDKSQYNRAVLAKRQSGSVFKFFVYAAAMEQGYSLNDLFVDKEASYFQGKGLPLWIPQNFKKEFLGEMTLEDAFAKSINTIAVQLSEKIGRAHIITIAHKLGINSNIPNLPSIALGTTDVSLLEITQSFATVANNGIKSNAFSILKITDNNNNILYEFPGLSGEIVLDNYTVNNTKALLRSVVTRGTGHAASVPFKTVYGKTGTTQDHRDAWFVGFTDDIVTGVWIGNDDNSPMNHTSGGNLPAWIFKKFNSDVGHIPPTELPNEINPWQEKSIFDLLIK